MLAVMGVWDLDPTLREIQQQALQGIVTSGGRAPGIIEGYWAAEAADPARSHTLIVFGDRESAEAFPSDVHGNLENQARAGVRNNSSLDLAEISATT